MLSFALRLGQLARISAFAFGSLYKTGVARIQFLVGYNRHTGRPLLQLGAKLRRPDDECPGRSGRVRYFMIRRDHGAISAIAASQPLNHLVGRNQVLATLARGGSGYFTTRPDLSLLFDDIRLARPTELLTFPRALEMIHRHYLGEVVRRRGVSGG